MMCHSPTLAFSHNNNYNILNSSIPSNLFFGPQVPYLLLLINSVLVFLDVSSFLVDCHLRSENTIDVHFKIPVVASTSGHKWRTRVQDHRLTLGSRDTQECLASWIQKNSSRTLFETKVSSTLVHDVVLNVFLTYRKNMAHRVCAFSVHHIHCQCYRIYCWSFFRISKLAIAGSPCQL